MELSGTGTMVVAVVKCKLVELCLTSCRYFGICAWEAETSRTVVVNKANAFHSVGAVRVPRVCDSRALWTAPRRAARYNQLPRAMNNLNVAQGAM